ncbi:nuclease domain-containing protein, partial [Salinimicrobium oceani]
NRTFSGNGKHPSPGSWTKSLRPDYTLSIWPSDISEEMSEKEELIVHIHFDAKYKIENLVIDQLGDCTQEKKELDEEKKNQQKGSYKNADLLKMHAYKDAIKRTGGAYVLYPGTDVLEKRGFHEILPGLGAFPVRPSRTNSGIEDVKDFILRVVDHFLNRASQRENIAYRIFDIHKEKPNKLKERLPEAYGPNRDFIPDDTSVLIAYYRKENLDWILKNGLINLRTGNDRGSLRLGPSETGARYILLHGEGETLATKLFKVTEIGPRIFSKENLINKGYPSNPAQEFYLVYKIHPDIEEEFIGRTWN